MKSLSQLKQEIKEEAASDPEKFFATKVLREKGFNRGTCRKCGMNFWSINEEREICGEPECGDGYTFINNSPTDENYTHKQSWKAFEEFMTDRGYTSINRYPTVARWRDDVEFTGASIYCFQPYVVSGEAEPPAKELIIPQPSLRFNDVDNVGITGRHYTNFTMIGQTCFQPPGEYDQDRYFRDMLEFTVEKLGIPKQKLVLHEDSWGGGGNLGACMEFFVDGLELFNQVYMFYERTPEGYEELDLKVLDMGMGHERITWISNGTETSYESVMPETLEKMKKQTGLEVNQDIWESFLPYSSELNVDEVEDIDQKWQEVAEKMDMDTDKLKEEIKPSAALYSVAEHTRALIFALADGKIPSNTGGGHNLRMIYRRAKDFIEKYSWNLEITEVAKWHAEELESLYPELKDSIQEIEEILEVEAEKYEKSRKKAENKLLSLDSQPSTEKMIELYESHGVSPEMMEEHGYKVPEDFYTKLGSSEEALNQTEESFDIKEEIETEKLYYEKREPYRDSSDSKAEDFSFTAEVKQIIEDQWIVLDRTLFYPEGGGQSADTGKINGSKVEDVQKQGNAVLHKLPDNDLNQGDKVECTVDGQRRKQLTQHHSTTHIVNAASREVLGDHIYQAGANKTTEKARLDLTHYEKPSKQELRQIESKVQKTINQGHRINVIEEKKSQAEQEHGFRIYQGGAPPGNQIRLIEIEGVDIEACGGTHLTKTSHAEDFVLTGCRRIQDGTIRMDYKAGRQARKHKESVKDTVKQAAAHLSEDSPQLDKTKLPDNFKQLRETAEEIAEMYSVEVEELPDTLQRFKKEIKQKENKIKRLEEFTDRSTELDSREETDDLVEAAKKVYKLRKQREKQLENLESEVEDIVEQGIRENGDEVELEVPTDNIGLLIQVSRTLSQKHQACIALKCDKGAVCASQTDIKADEKLGKYGEGVQGDEGFAKIFNIE